MDDSLFAGRANLPWEDFFQDPQLRRRYQRPVSDRFGGREHIRVILETNGDARKEHEGVGVDAYRIVVGMPSLADGRIGDVVLAGMNRRCRG